MDEHGAATNSDSFTVLQRDTPWRLQAATGGVIGLVPLLIGAFTLYMTISHRDSEPLSESWVALVVGTAFALIGLLLVYSAIHQLLASRIPEAEVAIDRLPLRAGETFRLRIRQPGPVRLSSLSAKLLCEVATRHERPRRNGEGTATYYSTDFPYRMNLLHSGPAMVMAGKRIEQTVEFTVPAEAEPTDDDPARKIAWRIELWGAVPHWPDFMHPFTVPLQGKKRAIRQPAAGEPQMALSTRPGVEWETTGKKVPFAWRVAEGLGFLIGAPVLIALIYFKFSMAFNAPHSPTPPFVRVLLSIALGLFFSLYLTVKFDRLLQWLYHKRLVIGKY